MPQLPHAVTTKAPSTALAIKVMLAMESLVRMRTNVTWEVTTVLPRTVSVPTPWAASNAVVRSVTSRTKVAESVSM